MIQSIVTNITINSKHNSSCVNNKSTHVHTVKLYMPIDYIAIPIYSYQQTGLVTLSALLACLSAATPDGDGERTVVGGRECVWGGKYTAAMKSPIAHG